MNRIIKDALRIANKPMKFSRSKNIVKRKKYATDGAVEGVPEEESQEKFLKEQLEGSAPQYDPEAGLLTGKRAGLMAAGFAPGSGVATAAGKFPTAEGGFEPSVREDIREKRYGSAALKALGAAGDIAYAAPVVGPVVGAAMKAPLAAKLVMAAAPIAKAAHEIAPVAKVAEEAAPAVKAAEEVAPALTKTQSQEAMKKLWAEGQGNPQYKNPMHQWNVEEWPKFRVEQPAQPQVKRAPEAPQELEPYDRVTNEIGHYSYGAEAARQLKQQKGTPQEMLAALKNAGVKPEEIRWSGIERAFADRPTVTGEELATHFEENLPKVSRIEKTEEAIEDQDAWEQAYQEAYDDIHAENYDFDLQSALEDHDLENMSERERERLEERISEQLSENYSEQASQLASERAREIQQANAPKWGADEYNFPGGSNYKEHILKFPHTDVSGYHPDVMDPLTQEEYKNIKDKYNSANSVYASYEQNEYRAVNQFHEANAEKYAADKIAVQKARGHQFTDPAEIERLQANYFDLQDKAFEASKAYDKAWRTNAPNASQLETIRNDLQAQTRDAYETFNEARLNSEEGTFDRSVNEIKNMYAPEELARMMDNRDQLYAIYDNPDKLAAQEATKAARKELYDFENELRTVSDALWADVPNYQKNPYEHTTHTGDIQNPFWQGRFKDYNIVDPETGDKLRVLNKSEGQSDYAKQDFIKPMSEKETAEMESLAKKEGRTPEENLRLSELLTNDQRKYHEAPYVGNVDKWAEVSAKDTLAHAIEDGYDRIFITGGEEQAKRWSGSMRKHIDNVEWITRRDNMLPELSTEMKDPYSHALFGKPYNRLNYEEANILDTKMSKILNDREPNLFPGDIYKIPSTSKNVLVKSQDGEKYNFTVKSIKQPSGSFKHIIMRSNLPGANGESLSALLGPDMAKKVMGEESGVQDMEGYMMGSSGYEDVYNKAYPKAYRKIMKSLDPEAKVEEGTMPTPKGREEALHVYEARDIAYHMTPEQEEKFGDQMKELIAYLEKRPGDSRAYERFIGNYGTPEFSDFMKQFTSDKRKGVWVHITPKMRQEYMRLKRKYGAVFPAYKRGGMVKPHDYSHLNRITKRGLAVCRRVFS